MTEVQNDRRAFRTTFSGAADAHEASDHWNGFFPWAVRIGGAILGAFLATYHRPPRGAWMSAVSGGLLLGGLAHVGMELFRREIVTPDGQFHADRFDAHELIPRHIVQRVSDFIAKFSRSFYGDGTHVSLQVNDPVELLRYFAVTPKGPRSIKVPLSGALMHGHLEGVQVSLIGGAGLLELSERAPDGTRALRAVWGPQAREGESYPASLRVTRDEATTELRMRITRPRIGPLGSQTELALATVAVAKLIGTPREQGITREGWRDETAAIARALGVATALLDPVHPQGERLEGLTERAVTLAREEPTEQARARAADLRADIIACIGPSGPPLRGLDGWAESGLLHNILDKTQARFSNETGADTQALAAIRQLVNESHPLGRVVRAMSKQNETGPAMSATGILQLLASLAEDRLEHIEAS